jgi:hypothetical protein
MATLHDVPRVAVVELAPVLRDAFVHPDGEPRRFDGRRWLLSDSRAFELVVMQRVRARRRPACVTRPHGAATPAAETARAA